MNRFNLALVIGWSFWFGYYTLGDIQPTPEYHGYPADCRNAIPIEAQLEEGLNTFGGYLGCGVGWTTSEPEDDDPLANVTPEFQGGEPI